MTAKRIFDVIFSALALLALSPLLLAISCAIWLIDGGPVLFRQERVGKGGRRFLIIKFRTMVEAVGTAVTVGSDPRITVLGGLLRRWKLDELPQLANVLVGDMSIVGPRPEVPKYVALYSEKQRRVLSIRPGITDWATIRFRNEQSLLAEYSDGERAYREVVLPEKLALNLVYVEERGFWTDIGIILQTIAAIVIRRRESGPAEPH